MSYQKVIADCAELSHAIEELLLSYFNIIEDLPDDLVRILSRIRECLASSRQLTAIIENLGDQIARGEQGEDNNQKLKDCLESQLIVLNNVNDEKLSLATLLNKLICENIVGFNDCFEKNNSLEFTANQACSGEPSAKPSGSQDRSNSKQTPITKSKRGRKPKRNLCQLQDISLHVAQTKQLVNENEVGNVKEEQVNLGIEAPDLMMLAEIAEVKERSLITVSKNKNRKRRNSCRKKTIRALKKEKKRRKKQVQVEQKVETEASETDDSTEVDDNEPLYCLCNRVGFGDMVECDNEGCSLEWFHFPCVGLRQAPKGKWYCPKCRSKKSNMLKREIRSSI